MLAAAFFFAEEGLPGLNVNPHLTPGWSYGSCDKVKICLIMFSLIWVECLGPEDPIGDLTWTLRPRDCCIGRDSVVPEGAV